MSVKHLQLGNDLGLTLEGYIEMGTKEAMKGKCILCGDTPEKVGVLIADGTPASRRAIGTPNVQNPYNHRLAFWAVCGSCQFDPELDEKVKEKVLGKIMIRQPAPHEQPSAKYVVCLEEGGYLGQNQPTIKDIARAARFQSKAEADDHMNVFYPITVYQVLKIS